MDGQEAEPLVIRDGAEFAALLAALQQRSRVTLGGRALLLVGLLAGGFVLPGAVGQASFCLSAVAGLAAIGEIGGYVSRNLLIDLQTFHEVIRPRDECAALMAAWLTQQLQDASTGDLAHDIPEPRS